MDDVTTNHDNTEDDMTTASPTRAIQRYPRGERNAPAEYRRVTEVTDRIDHGEAEANAPGSTTCPHCGAWGRYVYTFTTDDGERHAAMAGCIEVWPGGKQAVADYKRVLKRLDTVADNAALVDGLDAYYDSRARVLPAYTGLLAQMLDKAAKYDMSERQADLIRRLIADQAQATADEDRRNRERAEREAKRANAAPVPTGDGIVIEGTLARVYWQDNDFGGSLRMIVEGDDGWRAWGTLPASLQPRDEWDGDTHRVIPGAAEGDRIQFTGNVTASDDDPSFGFVKRPRKATIITDDTEAAR